MTGFSLLGCISDSPLLVCTCADDVNIFIKNIVDTSIIVKALEYYEKASYSKVNWNNMRLYRWESRHNNIKKRIGRA